MTKILHRSHAPHPLALADGRVIAPGEPAMVEPADPHDAALIADGALVAVTPAAPRSRRGGKDTEGGPT